MANDHQSRAAQGLDLHVVRRHRQPADHGGLRVLCLRYAHLDHLVYLPRGDPTGEQGQPPLGGRRALSRTRKRYERQGLLVEEPALPGGWAWAVAPDGERHASGGEPMTTNQRMDSPPWLEALRALSREMAEARPVEVVSDSTYVVDCFRDKWYVRWQATR